MWKDSYKTGVERIDFQHKALFDKSDELLRAIECNSGPFVYQEIINFLKGYVVFHFRDEEAYQRSVHYSGYEVHKRAHETFTHAVNEFDRRLVEEDYSIELVKEMAGMLTAWLIYHVAYTDQRMVRGESGSADSTGMSTIRIITAGMSETLQMLSGMPAEQMKEYDAAAEKVADGIQVEIDLFGDINGTLTYVYTEEVAKSLFERMTMQRPQSVDAMVRSALSEITNIATGNTTVRLAALGLNCDIRPPKIAERMNGSSYEGVVLDTGGGKLKISAKLDQY